MNDDSRAGWSEPAADDGLPDLGLGERYRIEGRLGAGGMGEVFRAWDRHLERVVALKQVHRRLDDPGATAALLREARVTACLDHPHIAPVLDVGRTAGGQLFYTMRLVRGRTLEALAPELGRGQRLRHLVDVVLAVAHAHERGIVHRDLKAGNVMIGPGGETQVVDWGLARQLTPDAKGGTALCGTRRYLSPEALRGEPVGTEGDVFSLGAMIVEVMDGGSADDPDGWRRLAAGLEPPALRDLCLRALAEARSARYPDARSLGADLRAYLDGRLVGAHDYGFVGLVAHAARRWRRPLGIAAAVGVVLVAVGTGATLQIIAERDRAVEAELTADLARRRADANLARSLTLHAQRAVAAGVRGEAEVLAAHALALADLPAARGAAMAFAAQADPAVSPADLDCAGTVGAYADGWLCADGSGGVGRPGQAPVPVAEGQRLVPGERGLWLAEGHQSTFVRPDGTAGAPVVGYGALRVDGDRAARHQEDQTTLIAGDGPGLPLRPCGDSRANAAAAWDAEGLWVVCWDGTAVRTNPNGDTRRVRLPGDTAALHALAVDRARDHLLLGHWERIDVRDLSTGAVLATLDPEVGRIRRIQTDRAGRWALVVGAQGGPALLDLATRGKVLHLPVSWSEAVLSRDGQIRVGGSTPVTLDPSGLVPVTFGAKVGLASGDVSPDGSAVAIARADGSLEVWDVGTGVRRFRRSIAGNYIGKWASFSPDGAEVWFAHLGRGLPYVFDAADGTRLADPVAVVDDQTCHRLISVSDATACLSYGTRGVLWLGTQRPHPHRPHAYVDGSQTGPDFGVVLDDGGEVARIRARGVVEPVRTEPRAVRLAVSADGTRIAIATETEVEIVDETGRTTLILSPIPHKVHDVALSPDGAWVAASGLSGEVWIWRTADGVLRALLSGVHDERVPTVQFADGWLLTVGWDGRAHRWGLGPLTSEPDPDDVERRWALSLSDLVQG